jgi:hypothetical protein
MAAHVKALQNQQETGRSDSLRAIQLRYSPVSECSLPCEWLGSEPASAQLARV